MHVDAMKFIYNIYIDMSLQRLSGFALFSTMQLWECSEVQVNFRPSRNCGFLLLPLSNFPAFKVNLVSKDWCKLDKMQSQVSVSVESWNGRKGQDVYGGTQGCDLLLSPSENISTFYPQPGGLKLEEKYTNRVDTIHVLSCTSLWLPKPASQQLSAFVGPIYFGQIVLGMNQVFWKMQK